MNRNKWNSLYDLEHPPLVSFVDGELEQIYDHSRFGVSNNYGRLKRILLHRPSEDVNRVKENLTWWLWDGEPDLKQAQIEWDNFAGLLKKNGVEVEILEKGYPGCAKNYFMRDQATMTPWGVIMSRMALTQRWGEEQNIAKKIWSLDIPVLMMVTGNGIFEGGNYIPIDRNTVVIGRGIRSNDSGIAQVQNLLALMDIETVVIDMPAYLGKYGGYVHADVCFNPIDKDLAVVYPEGLPYFFLEWLRDRGFDMIEVDRDEVLHMGTNVLPLDARKVISVQGSLKVTQQLEDTGVKVIEIMIDELTKGGGGPRCLVMELCRT